MKSQKTKNAEFKYNLLRRMAKKANEIANKVEEIADASHWVDMCEEEVKTTKQDYADGFLEAEEVAISEERLKRAIASFNDLKKEAQMLDAHIGNFKDDAACLEADIKIYYFGE